MQYLSDDKPIYYKSVVVWISNLFSVVVLALFMSELFCSQYKMTGSSMLDAVSDQQIVLIDRFSYQFVKPERYDVVLFREEDGNTSIKRIVAKPGETVKISENCLFINGEKVDYLNGLLSVAGLAENTIEVDANSYFLLGDNPAFSEDSRFEVIGNVKESDILGKVWFCIYPLSDFGKID